MSNDNLDKYNKLKTIFSNFLYVENKNGKGSLTVKGNQINIRYLKNKHPFLLEYAMYCCIDALNISKKHTISTYDIYIFVDGWEIKNFSLKLFKYLNENLSNAFEDCVDNIYIHNKSKVFNTVFKLIKTILDPETSEKMKLIRSY